MMLTCCPACTTTFRVTPEQLKVRHGQVRCGRCQHVFNAIEYLVDEALPNVPAEAGTPQTPQPPLTQNAPTSTLSSPVASPAATEVIDITLPHAELKAPSIPDAVAEAQSSHEESSTGVSDTLTPIVEDIAPAVAAPRSPIFEPLTSAATISPLSANYEVDHAPAQLRRWPWVIGVLTVMLSLVLQAVIAYRIDLAANYPTTKTSLSALCEVLECSIGLPSKVDLVSIETSDLHPAQSKKAGLELTASLKNRAAFAQTWPYLELTLTDANDKALARRVIEPALYLPSGQSENSGFAATSELAVQINIDAGDTSAVGYRLYLFYP